jgi:hypothetical protein
MNTKKRIDGDYYIETINADDRVIINANALAVNGNLEVSGNLTYINTEQLQVITLVLGIILLQAIGK